MTRIPGSALQAAAALILAVGPAEACTGVFYSGRQRALVGNNEDWKSPFTRLWFVPARPGAFGRIAWGFKEGGTQGAMNDQGLFFDGFALKPPTSLPPVTKEVYPDDLSIQAMESCRTVAEVIALFERYDRQFLAGAQLFFADRTGDAVIIEGGALVRKKGDFQIVTNFRQSEVAPEAITDARYGIARRMLETAPDVDVRTIQAILAHTHQEGKHPTQYSNVCDLKRGLIHLTHFHNDAHVVTLDVRKELAKGRRTVEMASLFPESFAAMAYRREVEKQMAERLAKHTLVPLSLEHARSLVGYYAVHQGPLAGTTVSIGLEQGRLSAELPYLEKTELHPTSSTTFLLNGLEACQRFTFSTDRLTFELEGLEVVALRKR